MDIGYFAIYRINKIFTVSNYDLDIIQCINSIVYHLCGKIKYYTKSKLDKIPSLYISYLIEEDIHSTSFITKGNKHNFYKSIPFDDGVIYIFRVVKQSYARS